MPLLHTVLSGDPVRVEHFASGVAQADLEFPF
jgi:hypothetical protein